MRSSDNGEEEMNKEQFRELKNVIVFGFLTIILFQMFFYGRAQELAFEIIFGGILGIISLLGMTYYLVNVK